MLIVEIMHNRFLAGKQRTTIGLWREAKEQKNMSFSEKIRISLLFTMDKNDRLSVLLSCSSQEILLLLLCSPFLFFTEDVASTMSGC
jgi:hypothetical protein